ncbi:hypothetical protein Pst134EB_010770 [Puccinia striiformis f. sp. tritici]|nr:hypothetical protein Pst134EB_010770 [Puccinia striiformis f. sp. tritici]
MILKVNRHKHIPACGAARRSELLAVVFPIFARTVMAPVKLDGTHMDAQSAKKLSLLEQNFHRLSMKRKH